MAVVRSVPRNSPRNDMARAWLRVAGILLAIVPVLFVPAFAQVSNLQSKTDAAPAPEHKTKIAPYANRWAPYVSTPTRVVDKMLELANLKPGDTLYDLGCGDGRILIAAAGKYKAKAVGVEISPKLAAQATANIQKAGLDEQARVIRGDLLDTDFTGADVVTLYLVTRLNGELRPRLERLLKPGARVISNDYPVPGWKPTRVEQTGERRKHVLYVYEMPPAKI